MLDLVSYTLDFINNYLGPISTVAAIVSLVFVIWTWFDVRMFSGRRRRQLLQEIRVSAGHRPSILIIDLKSGTNIRASVEQFRKDKPELASVPEERLFFVERDNRLAPDDIIELGDEVRQASANIINAGTDTLHLFYAGPVVPALFVGAEFANTCRVVAYQHDQGKYINWGPLRFVA